MINDRSLGTKQAWRIVQLLLAEVAEILPFYQCPGGNDKIGVIQWFWKLWNFRVRVWSLWLPSMAAATFYMDDAVYYQGSGHFSKSLQLLLQFDPDLVESSCHAIIIVILLVWQYFWYSICGPSVCTDGRDPCWIVLIRCSARGMCIFISEN